MLRFFQTNTVTGEGRGSTWLELFFDLVYVAILVELGNRLSHNFTLAGTLEFAAIFIPIWWSWLALVFYTRYFPSDDIGQRLLTVLYMGAMILLAFEIHGVTGETAASFLLSYAITKFILVLMYLRAWYHYPEYRTFTGHHAVLYLLIGLMWIAIALIAPKNFWLWGAAVAADVFLPLFIVFSHKVRGKPQPVNPPLKHHYMLHRFGELTIIVLGEFFIKIITSSSGMELQRFNFYLGGGLLLISVSMWWLYFDHTDHTDLDKEHNRPLVWIYMHYFLLAAITAYGVVGTKVFAAAPGDILSLDKRLLLCIALAIAVVSLGIMDWASPEGSGRYNRRPHLNMRAISAVILLLLIPIGGMISVGWFIVLVVLVQVFQVGYDIWCRVQNKAGEQPTISGHLKTESG